LGAGAGDPLAAGSMQKPVVEAKPAVDAAGMERAVLERVSHELAAYIGPIAEIVVKRAAKRCMSVTELCSMVAQEIEAAADRAKFLASCRR
jgi:serine/threonine-protein kinase